MGSFPCRVTNIPHAAQHGWEKKKKETYMAFAISICEEHYKLEGRPFSSTKALISYTSFPEREEKKQKLNFHSQKEEFS